MLPILQELILVTVGYNLNFYVVKDVCLVRYKLILRVLI